MNYIPDDIDPEDIASPEEMMFEYEHYDPDFEDHDYEDDYMGDHGGGLGGLSPFSFQEIMEHCLEPTVRDGLAHVGKVVVWCVIFRVITQSTTSASAKISRNAHLVSIVIGTIVLGTPQFQQFPNLLLSCTKYLGKIGFRNQGKSVHFIS